MTSLHLCPTDITAWSSCSVMVATRLSEVTAKGIDWAYGSNSPQSKEVERGGMDDYFHYASETFLGAMDQTRASVSNIMSSFYTKAPYGSSEPSSQSVMDESFPETPAGTSRKKPPQGYKYPDLEWILKNPYNSVRGGYEGRSSLSAVRSLIPLIPVNEKDLEDDEEEGGHGLDLNNQQMVVSLDPDALENSMVDFTSQKGRDRRSESASQLAEGTVRALRDLFLEEALELHKSLRFWTVRWERPVLSWLEAGPWGKNSMTLSVPIRKRRLTGINSVVCGGWLQPSACRPKGIADSSRSGQTLRCYW